MKQSKSIDYVFAAIISKRNENFGTDDLRKVKKEVPKIEFTRKRCAEIFYERARTFANLYLSTRDRHQKKVFSYLKSAYMFCANIVSDDNLFANIYYKECCFFIEDLKDLPTTEHD